MLSRVSLAGQSFVDEVGRTCLFHGTNAIVKGPPWYPDYTTFSHDISMSKEDFAVMEELGLNVLRLGVMWPGVEPTQGDYDEEYLTHIANIVELAGEFGVYTLLDMHQDGLSEYMCGEGLPTWAVRHTEHFDADKHAYPWPFDSPITDFYAEDKIPGSPLLPSRDSCHSKNQGQSVRGAKQRALFRKSSMKRSSSFPSRYARHATSSIAISNLTSISSFAATRFRSLQVPVGTSPRSPPPTPTKLFTITLTACWTPGLPCGVMSRIDLLGILESSASSSSTRWVCNFQKISETPF